MKKQKSAELSEMENEKKTTKKPYIKPSYEKKSDLYKHTGAVYYYTSVYYY